MRKSKNILENYKQNLSNYPKTLTRGVHWVIVSQWTPHNNNAHWLCSQTQKDCCTPNRTHEEHGKHGKLRKRRKSLQASRTQAFVWEVAQ